MHAAWQAQYKRHLHQRCWEVRALISWEGLQFGGASDLQVCQYAKMILTGPGAALYTDGVEKSQNALARGRQLCAQLPILEGSFAELLPF